MMKYDLHEKGLSICIDPKNKRVIIEKVHRCGLCEQALLRSYGADCPRSLEEVVGECVIDYIKGNL